MPLKHSLSALGRAACSITSIATRSVTSIAAYLFVCTQLRSCVALDNGLARLPFQGWNSWNVRLYLVLSLRASPPGFFKHTYMQAFGTSISEEIVKQTADLMVTTGLRDAGYVYLGLDDGWMTKNRSGNQAIAANPILFPGGVKALADYVHARGLRFGVYSDSGQQTCGGNTGSLGYEKEDAAQFAAWGVDLLKYDDCFIPSPEEVPVLRRYDAMRNALNATGRPILFSICEWGSSAPWLWAPQMGNTWRTTQDVKCTWPSIMDNLDGSVGLGRYAGPGAWNDADLLQVGPPGEAALSHDEAAAHFALWAVLKSPLVVSTNLRLLNGKMLDILMAKEVIAINQDPLGVAGDRVWKVGPAEVYAGPLSGGARAVVLLNRHDATDPKNFPAHNLTVYWESIGLPAMEAATVRDLYLKSDLGNFTDFFTGRVPVHGVLALRITPLKPVHGADTWRPWMCNGRIGLDCPYDSDSSSSH